MLPATSSLHDKVIQTSTLIRIVMKIYCLKFWNITNDSCSTWRCGNDCNIYTAVNVASFNSESAAANKAYAAYVGEYVNQRYGQSNGEQNGEQDGVREDLQGDKCLIANSKNKCCKRDIDASGLSVKDIRDIPGLMDIPDLDRRSF